jgi:hypothetical protein
MTRNRHIDKLFVRSAAALFIVFVFFTAASAAASLDDYKQRLLDASEHVSDLVGIERGEDEEFVDSEIETILKGVPASENIEWKGGSLTTDNGWLAVRLSEFRSADDISERNRILAAVKERIASITAGLEDLETNLAAGTKDADKQKLGEILKRPEYQKLPPPQKSKLQQWVEDFWNWLARVMPRSNIQPSAPGDFSSLTMVLQIVLYAVVFILVGFLIYKFAPAIFPRLRRKRTGKQKDRVILGEKIEDDASAHDIFDEAEALARSGDIRAAIRKGYIALLCELSDRRVIGLARHKTNRDYLRDLRKTPELRNDVLGLTKNYEEHWYGFRSSGETDWENFRTDYRKTLARKV